ncbi:MAG TPA: hypothetical protein VD761_00065, partial [Solirubrobacterales bacterium]|nr:hypothetical protein [Solirubrobacterales bacterium]
MTVEQRESSGDCSGADPDDLIAVRPDPDQADRDLDELGDEGEVVAGCLRQVRLLPALLDLGIEAGQLLVLGCGLVQDR